MIYTSNYDSKPYNLKNFPAAPASIEKETMKLIRIALTFTLFFISCSNNYIDVNELDVNKYTRAAKELTLKKGDLCSMFATENPSTEIRHFTSNDFDKKSIAVFPQTYNLLKHNLAKEIVYISGNCIFILLKIHSGRLVNMIECLKIGVGNDCYLVKAGVGKVEKKISLQDGLEYQLISQYADL